MRRSEREITDRKEMEEILARATVCHLGLVDGDEPYVVPLNFGFDGTHLYFHAAREGRKLDLIRRNPKACFQVQTDVTVSSGKTACEWACAYRSVIGRGRAEIVEDDEAKGAGLDAIMAQYGSDQREYKKEGVAAAVIIKLVIESMTGKKAGF
jgi:nitroimidazol reductase NimA-like FMN-containing flavoprotein (pyridoxamine 5'-phosphate oxidase superfamily)